MNLDDRMKRALGTGLAKDPGAFGKAVTARFLAELPTGLEVTDPFHWAGALTAVRHLCLSEEHSAGAMRVLAVAGTPGFGPAAAAAGGPPAGDWTRILDRVRGTRLDRPDLLIVHRAFIATAPGYPRREIDAADLDAVVGPLLIGEADRQALISHGEDAVEPGRALRVDTTPVDAGEVQPGRRERRAWQAFEELAEADPRIACLADLLCPGYPEQCPGRIGAEPIVPAMLDRATASLGARYRSASRESIAAQEVLTALHRAGRERPLPELVTRHTRHLIGSAPDPGAARARLRATGGEYDAASAVVPVRRELALPAGHGHSGALAVAEAEPRTVVVAGAGAQRIGAWTLGLLCGLFALFGFAEGATGFFGGLVGTGIAVGLFLWAETTRRFAGAAFGTMLLSSMMSGTSDFFGWLALVMLVALVIGSISKLAVLASGSIGAATTTKENTP